MRWRVRSTENSAEGAALLQMRKKESTAKDKTGTWEEGRRPCTLNEDGFSTGLCKPKHICKESETKINITLLATYI